MRRPTGKINPNGLFVNLLDAASLVFTYAATAWMIATDIVDSTEWSPIPLFFIGVGFIIQASLSTFALASVKNHIVDFGNTALETCQLLTNRRLIERRPGRCMRSVADSSSIDNQPVAYRTRQPWLWCIKSVRWILVTTWILPLLTVSIPVAVYYTGTNGLSELCPSRPPLSFINWSLFQNQYVFSTQCNPYVILPFGLYYGGANMLLVLVVGLIQSPYTLWLHACELVTILSRDESMWRRASRRGGKVSMPPLVAVVASRVSAFLIVTKVVIHWLFGNMFSPGTQETALFFTQAVYFNMSLFLPPVFITYLVFRRRSGPQPVAFGHLQTLCDLADKWDNKRVFGGDKGDIHGVGHAGEWDEWNRCLG